MFILSCSHFSFVPRQGDYQELLGCILCRSFQDLAMQHLIPALEHYDCASFYDCRPWFCQSFPTLFERSKGNNTLVKFPFTWMKLNIAEPWRCIQFTVIIHIETPCVSFQVTIKSVHHSWPGILQSMPDLLSIVTQSAEFLGRVCILISLIKFMLVPLSTCINRIQISFVSKGRLQFSFPPLGLCFNSTCCHEAVGGGGPLPGS